MSQLVRENLDQSQIGASHYDHSYEKAGRLVSYWHQIEETLRFNPQVVVEIGTGSGFVARSLRGNGARVVTLDVTEELRPTILASVRSLPLADDAADVVVCCQVLEHLPFEELGSAVAGLWRVARRGLVISLPDGERYLRLLLTLGARLDRRVIVDWPKKVSRRPTAIDPQHFWEIGRRTVGLRDVMDVIRGVTGKVPRTYRVFENPYHRFFILEK